MRKTLLASGHVGSLVMLRGDRPYPNFSHFMPYLKLGHAENVYISPEIVTI